MTEPDVTAASSQRSEHRGGVVAPFTDRSNSADWDRILERLTAVVGVPLANEAARRAAVEAARACDEPMDQLLAAAGKAGLAVSVARAPLADAVWLATGQSPLLLFSPVEQRWIIVSRAGPFRLSVSSADTDAGSESISRTALAKRLGLVSTQQPIEFGILRSAEMTPELSTGYPTHHAGEHHPLGPVARFLAVIRPEREEIVAIASFSLVTGLLYLALPLAVSAFVTNIAFGNQSAPFLQALFFIGLALSAALAVSAIIRGLQLYTGEVIKRRLFVRLMADLSHRLPNVEISALQNLNAPELVNRFLDIVIVQGATERILLHGIPVVLGLVIGALVLGFYHPLLFGFSILLTAGLALTFMVGRGAVDASIAESRLKYETVGWFEELVRTPTLFKGSGGYEFVRQRSEQIARQYLSARKRYFSIWLRQVVVLLFLEVFATAAVLLVGGWLVLRQELTLGQLVASELIVAGMTYSMSRMSSLLSACYQGLAAVDKIGYLTDLPTERTDGQVFKGSASGFRIECRDVGFAYPSSSRVLQGFNLDLAPGECVALPGIVGRGSSTVLNLLFGMLSPDAGYLKVDGVDIRNWDLRQLRARSALLHEGDILAGSIAENLRLGREDLDVGVLNRALERVGVLEEFLSLPHGINTQVLSGGRPLSGRQRVRLLIARALAHRPGLLLIDDLLDGMDAQSLHEILDVLKDPACGWTVLISTHDPSVAELCDRSVEIDAAGSAGLQPPGPVRRFA